MSAKYHISDKTQRPNICRARPGHCPLREDDGDEVPHFSTKEEAKAYVERKNAEEYDEVPQSSASAVRESSGPKLVELNKTADHVRAGDIISGYNFTKAGNWEDDEAEVAKVESFENLDSSTTIAVTYDNGNVAEYSSKSKIRIKRKTKDGENNDITPQEIAKNMKEFRSKARIGDFREEEADRMIEELNSPNANLVSSIYADRAVKYLEEMNDHHRATLFSAASDRIRMRHDKDAEPRQPYDLLYDKERTDPEVHKRLSERFPKKAEMARMNRENRLQGS